MFYEVIIMNTLEQFQTNVWPKIVEFLNENSQAKYTHQGWYGPCIWSEDGDIKRIITRFCEDEFGLICVHNETKIAKYTFSRFKEDYENRVLKSRQRIDIDITDASSWKKNYDFMNNTHDLFIEVKGLRNNHTWSEPRRHKIPGFEKDCAKLKILIDNDYCKHGVAILVDQGDKNGNYYILDKKDKLEGLKTKYSPVVPLIWQYPKIV